MVARSVRRSLRDPEAFFTALMLPVILMLLFVYVFGGAMHTGTAYVDYVVPGLIVLCAGFGAGTTADGRRPGHDQRHRRPVPVDAVDAVVGAHRPLVASLVRNLLATALVIAVGLAVGWRPPAVRSDWVAASAVSCCSSWRCPGSPPPSASWPAAPRPRTA